LPVLTNRYGAALLNAEVPCPAILASLFVQVFRFQSRIKLMEHDVGHRNSAAPSMVVETPQAAGPTDSRSKPCRERRPLPLANLWCGDDLWAVQAAAAAQ
jgi:hypothetical protein